MNNNSGIAGPANLNGLTASVAAQKLANDGPNQLPSSSKPRNLIHIALGVIKEPMFILLVACGSLYMVLGNIKEGIILFCFVIVIMAIEFFQERKTEKALDALKSMASPRALVIRDGLEVRIAGIEVVIGDLIVLHEGDRVPADATVIESSNLLADESLLTGESVAVSKCNWDQEQAITQPGGDNLPFVFSGSMIVQGSGKAIVSSVGKDTGMGKIGQALQTIKPSPTRLKREMGHLVFRLTIVAAILCALVTIGFTLTHGNLLNGFLAGLTLAMAILPEEFPVILTVFMALGAWRMSKKKVLTRKPSAIETLGSANVLCTDKTGTLTENKMTVSQIYNGQNFFTLKEGEHVSADFYEIMEFGILSSQINPFDAMEKAISEMGKFQLKDTRHIHENWVMVKEYPLSKELMAMSRVFSRSEIKEQVIASKGAPEAIFDLCHLVEEEKKRLLLSVEQMASKGLRILGVARATINTTDLPDIQHDFHFDFIGLIGLSDPVRTQVKESVSQCRAAGIRVIMITGDYPVTAQHIASEIGLDNPDMCMTGEQLQSVSDVELSHKIEEINIFARIVPEQKLIIVEALQRNGAIVAMTGDGVNDAPALKAADIGIAMGQRGTDVARESASLVLMDDNFSSIVGAIRMGRRIFDNLQKAFSYTFAIHVPIAGLSLFPILWSHLPIILWPVHIVFLELIIDPACSIIFEAEKAEDNVMNRPPREQDKSFFGVRKILFSCLQGLGILAICLAVYLVGIHLLFDAKQVRTMTFITLIVSNIAVILTNRSWTDNIFKIIASPNPAMLWVTGGAAFFLTLVLTVPFFLNLFQFTQLSFIHIIIPVVCGLGSIIWFEIYKLFKNQKHV